MADITAQTTVEELVSSFGFSSIAQLEMHLKRFKSKSSSVDAEVSETAVKVFEKISAGSVSRKWKTSDFVGMLFGLFSGSGCDETEKERRRVHAIVSKSLRFLTEQGQILKVQGANAAHTRYTQNPDYVVPVQAEESKGEEEKTESQADNKVEEEVNAQGDSQDQKPKARVRKKK